jgi:osmotically-inducible protein OsmY
MSHYTQLKDAVLAELKWEPFVDQAHIGVTAKAGAVSLLGHIKIYAAKAAAEEAAGRVKGVKTTVGELEGRLPSNPKRTDEVIAAAVIQRLAWDVSIPQDAVKVQVENGWINLTGDVDWNYQKNLTGDDVGSLLGVVGITNQIRIKPKVNAANLSDDITSALHRSWFYEPKTIFAVARDGNVMLSGTVHCWHDREVAGTTPGPRPVRRRSKMTSLSPMKAPPVRKAGMADPAATPGQQKDVEVTAITPEFDV